MGSLTKRILAKQRKTLLGHKAIYCQYRTVSAVDLFQVERKLGCALPSKLCEWLLEAGYGDLNEQFSFRQEWFDLIDRGLLVGHIRFAQDDLGNFYAISPTNSAIHYLSRKTPEYALMSTDFTAFLEEFERRQFDIEGWVDQLQVEPYDWV